MKLSVIIVSYNAKKVLVKCLSLLGKRLSENFFDSESEIIVVDNNSKDGAKEWLGKHTDRYKTAFLKENIGFGRANNVGLQLAAGDYILYLNSDVCLEESIDFEELFEFLEQNKTRAGLTIKLVLPGGQIDPASHRGFPTPWNALTYFSQLETLTKNTPLAKPFGGYHLAHLDLTTIHRIDSPTAAFFLLKKKVVNHLGGFDPDYFFYGEDLDLSYRIKQLGYSIWYYPKYTARHLKYQSGKQAQSQTDQKKAKQMFYETMLTFYQKHYQKKYPKPVSWLVKKGVSGLKLLNQG